jgi:hypothetical protein
MKKYLFPLTLSVLVLALLLVLAPAQAEEGATAELEVIAAGLANPRGLTFGPDGSLYIAEAGTGGDGACVTGPEGEVCYGETGAVTKVTFDEAGMPDSQEQIVTGLSSLGGKGTGDGATGPQDLAFEPDGAFYVLMGLGADPALRDPSGPFGADGMNFGQLVAVDSQGGWTNVVDIAGYEAANNPDGKQVDSNPFGMLADGYTLMIVDAGGNSLLSVSGAPAVTRSAAAADINTIATFPTRMVEFPPGSGQMMPMDAVPTAVEIGPDGAYYVSQLTGFPYPVGGAAVWRVVPGEDPTVYAGGFTNILDLAFGADGSLFVLEMAHNSLLVDPPVGRITQVMPYGARIVIAEDGLIAPVDMEIGPDYALYVANFGPVAALGQVVRIPLANPAQQMDLPAVKDNTLYENAEGVLSNGRGQHFFAGKTAPKVGPFIRRGLVGFDLSGLPDGSLITAAGVQLHMSKSISGAADVSLHKTTADWGEGDSDAPGEEGAGALAQTGDATWLHTFFDTELWATAGGDFAAAASATTAVDGTGTYEWSSPQILSDVQTCLATPDIACSWLVMGDETQDTTAKRFDTRENPEEANRPLLTVEYVMPLPDYAVFMPVVRNID